MPPATPDPAARKARSERLNRIMWAYVCGAIGFVSFVVGLERTFIPLGFDVLGCVLVWQLAKEGERRNAALAGVLVIGGIIAWLAYNWTRIEGWVR